MSIRRYKFRKHIMDRIKKKQRGGSRASDYVMDGLRAKQQGGSRASEYVMAPLKTGCSPDVSHLKVQLPKNIDFVEGLSYNTTGGGKRNLKMKIMKQRGGDHQAKLDTIPEFLKDNMQAVEPGTPLDFTPNSNIPEPHSCLDLDSSIVPLNENVQVDVQGFPDQGIVSSSNLPFIELQSQQTQAPQEQVGGNKSLSCCNKTSKYKFISRSHTRKKKRGGSRKLKKKRQSKNNKIISRKRRTKGGRLKKKSKTFKKLKISKKRK